MSDSGIEYKWLVELRREITEGNAQVLYLYGKTPESIAEAIIEADDYYGEFGTAERMARCWTADANAANWYSEADAKRTAEALDRCCGGVAVAAEHGFMMEGAPNDDSLRA